MFPWYQSWDPNQDLPEDDRLGIHQIYGTTSRQWGRNPFRPQAHPAPPTTTTTTTTTTTAPKRMHPTKVYYPERRVPDQRDDRRHHSHHHHPRHQHPQYRPDDEAARRRYNPDRRRIYTERPTITNSLGEETATRRSFRPNIEENPDAKPNKCDTSYDAISMIRGQLFIFKNKVRICCWS